MGLDHRMGSIHEYPDTKLTKDEIQLVLTHGKFFEAHMLPETEPLVRRAQKLRAVTSMLLLDWDPVSAPENPPSLSEYDDYIPSLVKRLEGQATAGQIAQFLKDMTARSARPPKGAARDQAAAAGLLRLRQSWT